MKWIYHKPKFEYEVKFNDVNWAWAGHKFFAYDFVRNFKPKRIVELGTHKGTSFFSFCQAVKDEGLDSELNAIDTWKGDEHAGLYGEEIFDGVMDIKNSYYGSLNIKLIRKLFDDAVGAFEEGSIDLLHIDGLHTYEAVKHDFETWLPKVCTDGVIFFHDICEKTDDFGVYKLWAELKERYATIEFDHSHGLGILFVNSGKIGELPVFEEIWKMYYESLIEKAILIDETESFAKKKDEEISVLNEVIARKDEEILQKLVETAKKDEEVNILNEEMVKERDDLRAQVAGLEKLLNDKIQEQNERVQGLQDRVRILSEKLDIMNNLKVVKFLKKLKLLKIK